MTTTKMRITRIVLFLVIGLFLCSSFSPASETTPSKQVLENGLTVLVTRIPSSPVVSVYALAKTGSATEGPFLGSGISHFLEHMVFKGAHGGEAGELAARIQAVGGRINASTGMDYTIYTITVPHEAFDVALDVLFDLMAKAAFDPVEVERERNVIFNEMRMRNDDPGSRIGELTFQNVFLRHPYRHPIIGYQPLLAEVTRDDLVTYYQESYAPNNMVLSIAGNIDEETAFTKARDVFGVMERRHPVVRNLPREPGQVSPRRYEEGYPTDLTRLSMAFAGIELLHPDLYALDVLAQVLGQGRSSRLYLKVYKKGLVHSISAGNYTPIDRGAFMVNALLEEARIAEVEKAVLDEIKGIQEKGIKPEELDKAKQQVRSEHVLGRQTSSGIAYAQAVDEAYAGDPAFSQEYVDGIARVTLDNIKRVARTYLKEEVLTTVVLRPKGEETSVRENAAAPVAASDIQKHVLANGLTVLLKEDHAFPVVSVRLAANGGVRQEPVELNGLFAMLASAWTKGTRSYSADELAAKIEGLGMSLGGFSGRNSFGLGAECLAEQLPTALDLVKELVFSPTFPDDEIALIKERMKASIRERDDDIFSFSMHQLKQTLFLTHPFRLDEDGTLASVERITRDDLVATYERLAVAGNMVLSIFGDMDADEVLKEVQKAFGGLNPGEVAMGTHAEAPPEKTRELTATMDKQQAMVMTGFQGVAFTDKDAQGLEVLATVLGSSFSGRLFASIREELGQAYTLGGDFVPGPDAGFVYFYVLTSREQAGKVKELLIKEISALHEELVPDGELTNVKTYMKGMFEATQEKGASLNFLATLDELYGLGYDYYQGYGRRVDAVTQDDLRRLARTYLDINKAAVVTVLPEEAAP